MNKKNLAIIASGLLFLTGCSSTPASEETVSSNNNSAESAATDVALCNEIDPKLNAFLTAVFNGESGETEWADLNPVFMDADFEALESTDLVQSSVVMIGITLTSPVGNEEMIGEETANLLYGCESVGAPLSESQATIDAN